MQVPKLLWLKQNMGDKWWRDAERFFDLPDWLVWRATGFPDGPDTRSMCSQAIFIYIYSSNRIWGHFW